MEGVERGVGTYNVAWGALSLRSSRVVPFWAGSASMGAAELRAARLATRIEEKCMFVLGGLT